VRSSTSPTARAWLGTSPAFANAEFDALLDQANGIQDADARREIMAQLQRSCWKKA
jgi:ABC-type oligopeptide transport system substrate-binding subunit